MKHYICDVCQEPKTGKGKTCQKCIKGNRKSKLEYRMPNGETNRINNFNELDIYETGHTFINQGYEWEIVEIKQDKKKFYICKRIQKDGTILKGTFDCFQIGGKK